MQKNMLYIGAAVLLLAVAGAWIYTHSSPAQPQSDTQTERYMDIETFVRTNISTLSPVHEQLGGTFYVTSIEAHGGTGSVSYEDGHNAYTADFIYSVSQDGKPSVTSFTVRE